ncbi:MAG: mechanosensitive ion channel family protein [Limisphaerales bacterium]
MTLSSVLGVLMLPIAYFAMMYLGRVLKRRWGVKLGGDYQALCLSVGFFIATSFMEVEPGVTTFLKAAMIMLSTMFVVKLINRFYWEGYFQKKRQMIVPRFLTHSTMLVGLLVAGVVVAQFLYDAKLQGFIVSGGVATAGIALALQNILQNLFAGFTLQMDKPYKPGDWLLVDGDMGQVMEINWRSTRIRTIDHIYLDLPNRDMITNKIINLNYPVKLHAFRVTIPADYSSPPNQVRDILLNSVGHVEGVRQDPMPEVYVKDFDDRAAIYEKKPARRRRENGSGRGCDSHGCLVCPASGWHVDSVAEAGGAVRTPPTGARRPDQPNFGHPFAASDVRCAQRATTHDAYRRSQEPALRQGPETRPSRRGRRLHAGHRQW